MENAMYIYPVLQLNEGCCVSLSYEEQDTPTVWHGDPVEKACAFVEQGADRLHVTDIDALRGTGDNAGLIERIIREAGAMVQVSGGIRGTEQVNHWIDIGAARVVIGTNAVRFPDWTRALARQHPDQIIVSVDVWGCKVMIDGWTDAAMFGPVELAHAYAEAPLAAMIVTDIDRHLEYPDASFALTTRFADATHLPVIASGVVRTLDDISTLRYLPNIEGVMIGRSLHERNVDLAEALEVALAPYEPVARFT